MKRSVLLVVFLAIAGAVVTSAYFAMPWLAGETARRFLADHGFENARLKVERIGLTHAVVSGVDLGGDKTARARKITIDYSPGRLVRGVIDGLTIDQPELTLAVDAGGIDLGALEQFVGSDEGGARRPFACLGRRRFLPGFCR